MASILRLKPGIYEYKGRLGFIGYQTRVYVYLIELYNESGKGYCCEGEGLRNPAAGWLVKKTSVRKLRPSEITPSMKTQLKKRRKQACELVMGGCD